MRCSPRRYGWTAAASLALASGCADGERLAPAPVPPVPPVEGCVDIHADGHALPDPDEWEAIGTIGGWNAFQPFWLDDRGVHYAWVAENTGSKREHLLVTSFDAETGERSAHRVYDVLPPHLASVRVLDAAGSPHGAFAVLIKYRDHAVDDDSRQFVVLGHLDDPRSFTMWEAPWGTLEAVLFHVAWDGEAFAVHAMDYESGVLLRRLDPDGNVVGESDQAGSIGNVFYSQGIATIHTDPATGITRTATTAGWGADPGVWLSGHRHDGSLLEGLEPPYGRVLVAGHNVPPCGLNGYFSVVAGHGDRALLAYGGYAYRQVSCLQVVDGVEPTGTGVVLDDFPAGDNRAVVHAGDGWWMGMLQPGGGIEAYRLGEGGAVLSREPLVANSECSPACRGTDVKTLAASYFHAVTHRDQVWFGFYDGSDVYNHELYGHDEHPVDDPYRIVLAKPGCRYPTQFEILHPPE